MKTENQYQLDDSGKKFICPACEKRRFVRYIDQLTNEFLPEKYGICDIVENCGYALNPYEDGFGKTDDATTSNHLTLTPNQPQPPSFIHHAYLNATLNGYPQNNFLKYLGSIFEKPTLSKTLNDYQIGTSKWWPGSTIFWQIDEFNRVHAGIIMLYDRKTGKRVREPFDHTEWSHIVLKLEPFNLEQCFFGEHLLKLEPCKAVAIVKSEKTAIIASAYLPEFIWLATGSLSNITIEKFKPLSDRSAVLWPDLGCFDIWSEKAEELKQAYPNIKIMVSNLLETHASPEEKRNGLDLADYLVKFNHEKFIKNAAYSLQIKLNKCRNPFLRYR